MCICLICCLQFRPEKSGIFSVWRVVTLKWCIILDHPVQCICRRLLSIAVCCNQVHAEHEEKSEAGDMTRRLYVRQYSLPKGVDADHIRPSLSKDGVLTIEAAATSLSPTERLIPIEYRGHANDPAPLTQ